MNLFSCKKYNEWIGLITQEDQILNDALLSLDADRIYHEQAELDKITEPRDLEFWGTLERKYEFDKFSSQHGDIQKLSNGDIAYSGVESFSIRVIDPKSGEIRRELIGKEYISEDVRAICELGFGYLMGGGGCASLIIWGPDGKCDKGPKSVRNTIYEIIFDNQTGYFFTGESHTGKVRVWDINKAHDGMREMNFRTFQTVPYETEDEASKKNAGTISSLVCQGNGIIVGTGCGAGINFWDMNTESNLPFARIEVSSWGSGELIRTSDGTLIYFNTSIGIVDLEKHEIVRWFGPKNGYISSLVEIEPGILAAGDDKKNITFWQKNNGLCLGTIKTDGFPSKLCALQGGLVVGFGDGRVQVWGSK